MCSSAAGIASGGKTNLGGGSFFVRMQGGVSHDVTHTYTPVPMSLPMKSVDATLYFSENVLQTSQGVRLVFISSQLKGGPDDRIKFMLTYDEVDPTSPTSLATLPKMPHGWNPLDPVATAAKVKVELNPPELAYLEKIDALIKEQAVVNANKWFKQSMTAEEVERCYTPLVSYPDLDKVDAYKPTCSIKVQAVPEKSKEATIINVYSGETDEESGCATFFKGSVEDLKAKGSVLAVCELVQLVFQRGKMTPTLAATTINVWPLKTSKRGIESCSPYFQGRVVEKKKSVESDTDTGAVAADELV